MTLKQYRKSLGITQLEAGDMAGISKQSWYSLEKNWPDVSMGTLMMIAEFGVAITVRYPDGASIIPEKTDCANP